MEFVAGQIPDSRGGIDFELILFVGQVCRELQVCESGGWVKGDGGGGKGVFVSVGKSCVSAAGLEGVISRVGYCIGIHAAEIAEFDADRIAVDDGRAGPAWPVGQGGIAACHTVDGQRAGPIVQMVEGDKPGFVAVERPGHVGLDVGIVSGDVPDAEFVDLPLEPRATAEVGGAGGSQHIVQSTIGFPGRLAVARFVIRRFHTIEESVQVVGGAVVTQGDVMPLVKAGDSEAD